MTRNYTITEEPVSNNDEPTFPVCRGCSEYVECQGGHPEDCEQGYHDLQRALRAIANILHGAGTDDEKIILIRTEVN